MLMRNAVLERSLKECLLMAESPSQLLRENLGKAGSAIRLTLLVVYLRPL